VPNARFYYRIFAVNSVGTSAGYATANGRTVDRFTTTIPSHLPRNSLTATASGRTLIELTWQAPSDDGGSAITGYRIEVSTDGAATWADLVPNTASTDLTYRHRGLAANTTRHYRVRARNSQGQSLASEVATATTVDGSTLAVPSDPTNLRATVSGQTTINLDWTASANTGGSSLSGYKIEVSTDGATFTTLVASHSGTSYAHTGLSAGVTRTYQVRAVNTTGESLPSNRASATTGSASVPDAPTALSATTNGQTQIDLEWTAPSNTGGSAITGYRIQVSTDGGTTFTNLVANTGNQNTSYSHTGLALSTTRHYRVYARNVQGESASASNTATATTQGVTAPDAPTALSATAARHTQINLSWTAPANTGGSPITGYRIQISTDGGTSFSNLVDDTGSPNTSYMHTGLALSITRHYRVYAINAQGQSANPSNTAMATTQGIAAPAAPTALTITAAGRTILQLAWTAPANDGGSAITGYIVDVSSDGSTFAELARTTERTYFHRGLHAGATRHYRIRAVNAMGPGPASDAVRGTTPAAAAIPADPTNLMAQSFGRTLIELTWMAPADNGGAAITGYQIEVGEVSESNGQAVEQEGAMKRAQDPVLTWKTLARTTETRYVHRDLVPNTTRHYRVRAINAVGVSLATPAASATTTDDATPSIPSDPLELVATVPDPSTVTLTWRAPADDGGRAVTGYRIEVSMDGAPYTELVASYVETTYTDTGIPEDAMRHYRVRAINSVGESLPSNVAKVGEVLRLSFGATSATAPESAGAARIPLSSTTDIPVQVRLSGTATPEVDYRLTSTSSTNLVVTILDDAFPEPPETVVLTLTETNTYQVGAPRTYTLTITDDDEAVLDVAASIPNQSWIRGLPIEPLILPAAAHGRAPYTYTLTPPLPAGLRFDAMTRQLSGIPGKAQRPVTHTYTVTDADKKTATRTFTIEVTALAFAEMVQEQVYVLDQSIQEVILPAAHNGVPPYQYSLAPALPAGLIFDAPNRTLSGTPEALAAPKTFTYTVTDRMQTQVQASFRLEVYTISFDTQVAAPSYVVGVPIPELVLPEVIGARPPVAYTLTLLDLPVGLEFDLDRRVIHGTPLEGMPPVALTWKATDVHGAKDSLRFMMEVLTPQETSGPEGVPEEFMVYSNYPNPFRQATTLVFDLPWPAEVQVEVLDVIGRRMHVSSARAMNAGWNQALELRNLPLSSGAYLYRLRVTAQDRVAVQVGRFMHVR